METIRIFIASSAELEADRKAFRQFLSVENDRLHKKGLYLELVQWENFLDAVSQTSLQDDDNKKLEKCDIVVCLFFTKAGKYTQQEFDKALKQFHETGSPMIYTYFKSGAPQPDTADERVQDMLNFKKRLSEIGHFLTKYNSTEDLLLQFRKQLDRLEDKGLIKVQDEVRNETSAAVTNYINTLNANNQKAINILNITDFKGNLSIG